MSEARSPYALTLSDLRDRCRLLESIEVITDGLIGKIAGEVVVRTKGKITPHLVKSFRDSYQRAVAAGIIKPSKQRSSNSA